MNTSFIYHNKHELPLIAQHVRQVHTPPRPVLQCTHEVAGNGRQANGDSLAYVAIKARMHMHYTTDASCAAGHTWCSLVERRYLLPPSRKVYDHNARIK